MIYTALKMALPSPEDRYIPLSCEQLEPMRKEHDAEITANVRGTQLVVFLTEPDSLEPVGTALGWPGDQQDEPPDDDLR